MVMWGVRMTIEMLDKQLILVSLCEEDMLTYRLGSDESAEQGLRELMLYIGEECGLDHRGKSYLIEVMPSAKGCLLIISVRQAKRRKLYRVKRRALSDVCVFFDADAMLDFLSLKSGMCGYAVYRYRERYILLPDVSDEGLLSLLSEYGELYPVSTALMARVREHGRLLTQVEIQRRHIGGRAVAVGDTARGGGGG